VVRTGEALPAAVVAVEAVVASNHHACVPVRTHMISAIQYQQRPPRFRDVQGKLFTLAVQGFGRFDGGV